MSQWEGTPRTLIAVVAAFLLLLVAAYRFGIPFVARVVAFRLPATVSTTVTDGVLAALDGELLRPTGVPAARQRDLTAAFVRLQKGRPAGVYHLLFRQSPTLGANAVALPSGVIVVTDALVALARDDREILGVLAHEAGHIEHRHGMRLVLQGSAVALLIGLVVGDFTSLAAMAPTALLEAKYSRDFEREADTYAADVLIANGMSPAVLADMLERIEAAERQRAVEQRDLPPVEGPMPRDAGAGRQDQEDRTGHGDKSLFDYTASHPATRERLEYLRRRSLQ